MVLQSTLTFVSGKIILGLKLGGIIVSTIVEFSPSLRYRKSTEPIPRCISGAMGFVIAVLGFVNYFKNPYTMRTFDDRCMTADADIVGDGVRAATWTQFVILGLIAIFGLLGPAHTAIQEVGAGLLVTHIALAIALLIPAYAHQLSPVDSILGMMILDAQNSALSIQLVTKQTLASRWQTYTVIVGQAAGLAAIGMLIDNFTKNGLATDECSCVSAFWWGWISNCDEGHRDDHQAIWTYYALRVVTVIHSCTIASLKAFPFDNAKRQEEIYPCAKCETCTKDDSRDCCKCVVCDKCNGCRNCNAKRCATCGTNDCTSCKNWRLHSRCKDCPGITEFREGFGWYRGLKYSQIAATTSFSYIEAGLYSLFSLSAAEGLMSAYDIHPSSFLKAVGQMTNIVIAVATAIRALWVFGSLFWKFDVTDTGTKRERRDVGNSQKKDV